MIGAGRSEKDILSAARRGLSPSPADAERVRRGIEMAVQVAAARALRGAEPGGVATVSGPRPSRLARFARPWGGRLVALGAVAAVSAGLGYRAGWRAGDAASAVRSDSAPLVRDAREEMPRAPSGSPPAGAPRGPERGPPREAAGPTPRPTGSGARASSPRRAPAAGEPSETVAESLAEEVRVLRSVERALRDHEPAFAQALLRELDRTVPHGKLVEERLAVRTIARCTTHDVPFGVDLGADFDEHFPNSVYGRRVADACAQTDSATPGDKGSRRTR